MLLLCTWAVLCRYQEDTENGILPERVKLAINLEAPALAHRRTKQDRQETLRQVDVVLTDHEYIQQRCGPDLWADAYLTADALGYTYEEFAGADYPCQVCPNFLECGLTRSL